MVASAILFAAMQVCIGWAVSRAADSAVGGLLMTVAEGIFISSKVQLQGWVFVLYCTLEEGCVSSSTAWERFVCHIWMDPVGVTK